MASFSVGDVIVVTSTGTSGRVSATNGHACKANGVWVHADDVVCGMSSGLVSCEWLKREMDSTTGPLKLVDATWYLPGSPFAPPEGSEGAQSDYMKGPRLPGSVFFDIDAVSTPSPTGLPHMLPDEATFSAAMSALGIQPGTRVVAYDRLGIFSSPRFWYTLKVVFGHSAEVAVLDGGLPRWQELGYPVEEGPLPQPPAPAPVAAWKKDVSVPWDKAQMLRNVETHEALVLDARPGPRFHGEAPEPRPGMRSGHMPGSLNLPFLTVLTGPLRHGAMLPATELKKVVLAAGVPEESLASSKQIVNTCGSGMTACIVHLALHQLGAPLDRLKLYDGSWSEWGALQDTPIVKRGAAGQEEIVPALSSQ